MPLGGMFTRPFSSNVSTGRILWALGEIALIALQVLAIYTRGQQFSPLEFAAAYGAILAGGGFGVAKTDAVQADQASALDGEPRSHL